jgi:SAM-dependent methyltransferase
LGCGHKVSAHSDVVNIDWSMYLRMRENRIFQILKPLLLSAERQRRLDQLPSNIMAYDISRGIPFADNSVDVVFHSNMLEHLDRDVAEVFLVEALRVLKPGGVHRIVVPDFELACANYLASVAKYESQPQARANHDDSISLVLEQSVRREAEGTRRQPPLRRFIENKLLGDARQRGETHQWMYDRISLSDKLVRLGYREPKLMRFDSSGIANWRQYGLDTDAEGNEYAPGSLYMEAVK